MKVHGRLARDIEKDTANILYYRKSRHQTFGSNQAFSEIFVFRETHMFSVILRDWAWGSSCYVYEDEVELFAEREAALDHAVGVVAKLCKGEK